MKSTVLILSLAVAVLAALQAPRAMAQTGPGAVQSSESATRLTLYGQVNRALLRASDGASTGTFFVDNDHSSTRFGLRAEGAAGNALTIGSVIEIEIVSNSSRDVSLPSAISVGNAEFNDRRLEVYGQSAKYGSLWLGQGHTASDGAAEVDLTRTDVVASSDINDFAGGMRFNGTGPRISTVFPNMDGLGRDDRIRYDTPSFSGFRGSASYVGGGAYDLAVRFRGQFDRNTTLAAAVAYSDETTTPTNIREQYVASLSARRGDNWSGAIAIGTSSAPAPRQPVFYYGKLAYERAGFFGIGRTVFAVDVALASDIQLANDEFLSYGAYIVQIIDRAGADVYLGVRNHQLTRPGSTFNDIMAIMAGARVKF